MDLNKYHGKVFFIIDKNSFYQISKHLHCNSEEAQATGWFLLREHRICGATFQHTGPTDTRQSRRHQRPSDSCRTLHVRDGDTRDSSPFHRDHIESGVWANLKDTRNKLWMMVLFSFKLTFVSLMVAIQELKHHSLRCWYNDDWTVFPSNNHSTLER